MVKIRNLYKNLPGTPGVYLMKGSRGQTLYIGKAANLKRRVSSYFLSAGRRTHGSRTEKLVHETKSINYKKTDTALEALILEADLIKKQQPPYNIKEKDDKSFLYVEITKDKFPRVLLVRGQRLALGERKRVEVFGPFTSASGIREALKIIRRIFPYSIHPSTQLRAGPPRKKRLYPESHRRACFDFEIGLCPGTCIDSVTRSDYLKNIRNIKLLFEGKKKRILRNLEKEMSLASEILEFERARTLRRQIFALQHIQDVSLVSKSQIADRRSQVAVRVEGYDVSNISGQSAVGAMVVFIDSEPAKGEYRKFKIRTITQPDDVGMLREVLSRRFNNPWPLPDIILVDGGKPQVNAVRNVLSEFGLRIPVVGIAKGPKRKRNVFVGVVPRRVGTNTLIRIRDEAHRFAHTYHKKIRSGDFLRN
ncbi:MAG: GIY-YIG nuclease family protein [Patescibacteria group bacterium]|nr:GIY-YIG nuclease family protein [Patescibacteria group bacterium]